MKARISVLEGTAWLAAVATLGISLAWPSLRIGAAERETEAAAQLALEQIAAAERGAFETFGHYLAFGPTNAERQAVFPLVQLDGAAATFQFDAITDEASGVRLRAVTTPRAIADGAAPYSITHELPAPSHNSASASRREGSGS